MFPAFKTDPFTTPQARRSFIKYSISEDDWQNRTGNSLLSELSDLGIGIRRQDFYEVRREKLGEIARKQEFVKLEQDTLIPYSFMNEDTGIQLTSTAQYRVRLTVKDRDTNELSYIYRSVASDKHYTRKEIEEYVKSKFSAGGKQYAYLIMESVLHDVWKDPERQLIG